jgi:hypothetical protein
MSLTGLISGKNISDLDHNQFRRVLNTLLVVEASISRVPLGALDLSCRDNDPDGGIDARVQWPSGLGHDVLRDGENVLQYKSGKISLKQLRDEFRKSGVQEALRRGAYYVLLVGHDYIGPHATKRRQKLKQLCRNRHLDPAKCAIFFGSQISRWVARHPSVLIMPELGLGYPAFVTVGRWLQNPELKNPWKPDLARTEIIQKIDSFVRRETSSYVLRIEGPAGVGKTRIALEGVRKSGPAESVIYTPNADDPNVTSLLTLIQGDPQAYATIIVDECDSDRQEALKSYANLSEGRLRLVCVGSWDVFSQTPADSPNVLVLAPLSDTTIRDVLSDAFGVLPKEQIDVAVRLSGGFVKLALFVGEYLSRVKDVTADELLKIANIRQFLKRFVDFSARRALQLLSLFGRLGWEDELRDEAKVVANYFDVNFNDLKAGVKILRDKGVVVARGRYLYVSPDLLAISAAAELWDESGSDLIQLVEKLPREETRRQMLRRLASMGAQPQVRQAVERLLGDEGLFKTLKDLDETFRSEAFSILASALPEAAVVVLERIIERAPREELLGFKTGRRNVVWAIESLLRWPSISLAAARSLRALALAESESFGNNATGIFCEYFQMYLSRSPVPLIERLELIDELIEVGDGTSRLLAARGAASGLRHDESRMGGNIDDFSGRPYPPEWRPQKFEELKDSRVAVIVRLERIGEGQDQAAVEARGALIGGPFTLVRQGLLDEAIGVLESVSPRSDSERRALLDACKRVERDVKGHLSDEQLDRLGKVADQIFGNTYSARLKRWVGPRLHTDFNLKEETDGYREADEITRKLADEGYENGISSSDFSWLASPEAENAWEFAYRLGEIDSERKLLQPVAAASPNNINAVLLAGYLNGRASVEGQAFRDDFLDDLAESLPLLAFACSWRGASTSRGVRRVLKLVDDRRITPETLGYLQFGGWTLTLSPNEIAQLVHSMLEAGTHAIFDAAAGILINLLSKRPESLEIVESLVWRLVETKPERNWDWDWGRLATRMADRDPQRVVKIIVGFFSSGHFVAIDSDETMQALQRATANDPEGSWQIVGDAMLKGDETSTGLVVSLSKWYGELIPTETLIGWAKKNLPRGPWIVSRIIRIGDSKLPERARALLLTFPEDDRLKRQLVANLQTGVSVGPLSNRISADLMIVKGWTKDPDPKIRSWAKLLVKSVERQLKRRQMIEEEEGI